VSVLCAVLIGIAVIGCADARRDPPATQPATAVDPATTQPSYWLSQPAAAQVRASDFEAMWEGCKAVARSYLFAIDREDFRAGLITTEPMISKQWWEFWRPDTGAISDVMENSVATIRRTLRFEVARDEQGGGFVITPKVLVERLAVLERRITSVAQYRQAFAGPAAPSRFAVARDEEPMMDLPPRYWYPVGRDSKMEERVAARLRGRLERGVRVRQTGAGRSLAFDGTIIAPGPGDLVYVDLGAQHGVVPGMTFEVYDARAALPPLEHFGGSNPGSKGWVEVVRADQASSACRVMGGEGAVKPAPGDRVFNFVYQRQGQLRFALAGEFTGGRETVAGLIRQWRGVVDEGVREGTNYLIMGQAPADARGREAYRAAKEAADGLGVTVIDEARFNVLVRQPTPAP
jgi:hypothetical protein